jgi:hypothetical protein
MGWKPELVDGLLALAMLREAMSGIKGAHHNDVIMRAQANSRAYTLARLKCERLDLYERVKAKTLSANAAMQPRSACALSVVPVSCCSN